MFQYGKEEDEKLKLKVTQQVSPGTVGVTKVTQVQSDTQPTKSLANSLKTCSSHLGFCNGASLLKLCLLHLVEPQVQPLA